MRCLRCKAPTALEEHAKAQRSKGGTAATSMPIFYPMYTVPLDAFLDMAKVRPHEELKKEGLVVKYEADMGKAAFVSHEWLEKEHPDPAFTQMKVMQDTLRNLLYNTKYVSLDAYTEALVPSAKRLPTAELRSEPLYIWYDYFSCPQLMNSLGRSLSSLEPDTEHRSPLARAVDSIPAYVSACSFFFALCPYVETRGGLRTPYTWAQRGWCRVERFCRELSENSSWILVKSPDVVELISSPVASYLGLGGPPGEGSFTVPQDRLKLGPLMLRAIQMKLQSLLRAQDFVGYRVLLNLQQVHLRGFLEEPVTEPIPHPSTEFEPEHRLVPRFLYQNGFRHIHEKDAVGWPPIHYAALRGDPVLLRRLLECRANPNVKAGRSNPRSGSRAGEVALCHCMFYRHNEAVKLLLSAKAKPNDHALTSGLAGNNAEGIRLFRDAGYNPTATSSSAIGLTPVHIASGFGAADVLEELANESAEGSFNLYGGLAFAMVLRGARAPIVQRIVAMRADVDERFAIRPRSPLDLLAKVMSVRYRCGQRTTITRLIHDFHDATPLMFAVMTGNYEGAAALIALGAHIELRNRRGRTAADLAEGQLIPDFLAQAFNGNPGACHRVASLAMACVEEAF